MGQPTKAAILEENFLRCWDVALLLTGCALVLSTADSGSTSAYTGGNLTTMHTISPASPCAEIFLSPNSGHTPESIYCVRCCLPPLAGATRTAAAATTERHKEVVKLLRKTGAHFTREQMEEAASELCSLAASGDKEGLDMWRIAGADLTKPGYDGKTALEVAQAAGGKEMVEFLTSYVTSKSMNGGGMEFTAVPTAL